jgi:predicted HicB family RNase H-like nuclease
MHTKGVTVTNSITETFQSRCQKVLQVARQLHATRPDWVTFFRETLGVDGAARSVFGAQEDYLQFEQSREFEEIQNLVASLRSKKVPSKNETTKVITVRLPESLHESLKAEASEHGTSMNKLCITKLLKALSEMEEAESAAAAPQSPSRGLSPAALSHSQPGTSNFRSTYTPPQNGQG